jgi:DNA adenine methylase
VSVSPQTVAARTARIRRPALRYHGGKFRLAPWIISHFPAHRIYVEPFAGAASVLLCKERAVKEIYNDLDGEIVNLFRVVRDHGERLVRAIEMTPFAREEYLGSYQQTEDPVEQARRTIVRSYLGYGSDSLHRQNGFNTRTNDHRDIMPWHSWATYPAALRAVVERFRGVVIENRDALCVMDQYDSPETLHFLDPPYLHGTRSGAQNPRHGYQFELNNWQHEAILRFAKKLAGNVCISGYPSELYAEDLQGWRRDERESVTDRAGKCTEVLWMNYSAPAIETAEPGQAVEGAL